MNPMDIRHVARQSALDAIEVQKQEMRDLGVMADWDSQRDTYRTMGGVNDNSCVDCRSRLSNPTAKAFQEDGG